MSRKKLYKVVITALFAALTAVLTAALHIPTPVTHGHINLGDSAVLLGAFFLGPIYGAAAGGIGSMLAELILGYVAFAPGTLVIKGLMGLAAGFIVRRRARYPLLIQVAAGAAAEIIMIVGYFAYEATFLSYGWAAASSIPANALQGIVCLAAAVALYNALSAVPAIKDQRSEGER